MKPEKIFTKRGTMIVLNVYLDNFYAFKDFQMNLTYPKKIVDSYIQDEHLKDHPNFRYKKVNIIMGANASGKTTFGYMLMSIFNFISEKNHSFITGIVNDRSRTASFMIDLICESDILYRIACTIPPKPEGKYDTGDVKLEIRNENIRIKDSYESCIKRLEAASYSPCENYLQELEKMESIFWRFEYPRDTNRRSEERRVGKECL